MTLAVGLEITRPAGQEKGTDGRLRPIFSSRELESSIRLRDGETYFLAGLLPAGEGQGTFLPSLLDEPSGDVALALTPRIVRRPEISRDDRRPLRVGTESKIALHGHGR